MVDDARFEDGAERPLRLLAMDIEDLEVLSSLIQDAVFSATEMTWTAKARRFAVLINRFRWEDAPAGRPPERVKSVLAVEDVQSVRSQGVDRRDADMVLSLLALTWRAGDDGTGVITLLLAGDGEIELAVEACEVSLRDVTRPYLAPSGLRPDHSA